MPRLPKKLGDLIDLAYDARNERIEYQRGVDEKIASMKAKETEIKEAIISQLNEMKATGAKGGHATAGLTTVHIPQIDLENGGWPAVWTWAKKNDALDLFEKRLAKKAVNDRLEAGQKIPGVKVFATTDLSLTKINSK